MKTASWYLNRLRAMHPAELLDKGRHRVRRERWIRRSPAPPRLLADPVFVDRSPFVNLLPGLRTMPAATVAVAAAERILEGHVDVLGVRHQRILPTPDFFHDPVTGGSVDATMQPGAGSISLKHVWELSRHQYLTVVAMAHALTGDDRFAERVDADLRAWMSESPFMVGVHWVSGIEIGMRLQSWVWLRRLLGTWSGVSALFEHNPAFVEQVGRHQQWLAAFPSTGSSANNHRIAELAGLASAAAAFPWFDESDRWCHDAATDLAAQLRDQTFPTGVNRELASGYHTFVLELVLPAIVELEWSGRRFGAWPTVAAMLDAQAATTDERCRIPRQGDDDGGHGVLLDRLDHEAARSQLATGAALFSSPPWWPTTQHDLRSALLGSTPLDVAVDRPAIRPSSFEDAGVIIQADGDVWFRIDTGPHGLGPIHAHAHADALSVELRHRGIDILADPGTFCYGADAVWRDWFRSTASHNTLTVDGLDQSISAGTFLWSQAATTELLADEASSAGIRLVEAEHDGYVDRRGVVHRRRVVWSRSERTFTIDDRLRAVGDGTDAAIPVALHFHFGPEVEVRLDPCLAHLRWQHEGVVVEAHMELTPDLTWTSVRGQTDPIGGWYSPSFGSKVPTWSIVGVANVTPGVSLVTILHLPCDPGRDA